MGSGHILVYAFDVLYQIYKEAGYGEREIPRKILQNNLYGLDIDDRAAQLASFALIMKARGYNRRLFREIEREELELNLCSVQESNGITKEAIEYFSYGNQQLKEDIEYLVSVFIDAKEYGSILEVQKVNFEVIKDRLSEIDEFENLIFGDYRNIILDNFPTLIKQAEMMSRKYEVCVTNPPYMGYQGMNSKLLGYLKAKYPNSKTDLFAVFMEYKNVKKDGYLGIINQQSWMFLSSFEELRKSILKSKILISMIHLGARTFDEIGGEVVQSTAFIIQNSYTNYKAQFIKVTSGKSSAEKENLYLNNVSERKYIYSVYMKEFTNIAGNSIAYWLSDKFLRYLKTQNL